jgi:protein-disulfide isomerase
MRLKRFTSAIILLAATAAWGQGTTMAKNATAKKSAAKSTASAPASTGNEKANVLKPPPGAKVAIVEFLDLQCPDCARAAPLVKEVSKAENIPVIFRDFPLPMHNWSFQAAVIARYFDTKSKAVGDEWREYCFANQPLLSPDNLDQTAQKFAQGHGVSLPFLVDPNGKIADKIKADFALGQRIGIQHTPTLFVVTNSTKTQPFVEVLDRSKLTEMIEAAKAAK